MSEAIKSSNSSETCFDLFGISSLNSEVTGALRIVARVAKIEGFEAYLVGGMVRDLVADPPEIATSPDVTVIGEAAAFADAITASIPECELVAISQHHTAKVKIGNVLFDIASARTDTYDPYGSLPNVTLVNDIERDLARRDFTVNAMALPLNPDGQCSLIDPFNGRNDSLHGILRVIRSESFREDPIRMMRGIRLAARYGFRFDDATKTLIAESLDDLRRMSECFPQRVFNEFRLWFADHENLDELMSLGSRCGLLKRLGIDTMFPPNTFRRIPADEPELTRFAAFAYLLQPETDPSLAQRLLMPSDWTEISKDATKAHAIAEKCRDESVTDIDLYRALVNLHPNVTRSIAHIEKDNPIGTRFADFDERLRHVKSQLNGDDLIALGVAEGPVIGQILDELLALRIEGRISTDEEERRQVLSRLNDG